MRFYFKKTTWYGVFLLGIFLLVFLALSFTSIPYHAYHKLGSGSAGLNKKPDVIVLLGGSGMPSPDGLMRCYFAVDVAKKFNRSRIIIAHPVNENDVDSLFQSNLMKKELIYKGIDSTRILYEKDGFNTYSQAKNIQKILHNDSLSLLIVTSPEHMYRSIKTFQKLGFKSVGGTPTFEQPISPKSLLEKTKKKEHTNQLSIRYNTWSYMHYELLVLREYFAITYYWLKGWV